MAKRSYNTFVVVDCKSRKPILVTSSARKATSMLKSGIRIEIWNCNELVERLYHKESAEMKPYIDAEKEYHRVKQEAAEMRNKRR